MRSRIALLIALMFALGLGTALARRSLAGASPQPAAAAEDEGCDLHGGARVPYIHVPTPKPFGLPIQPFGVLVGIGLVLGYLLGKRRAAETGLDPEVCADGMVWTVVGGFILAHLVSVIFYFPDKILKEPWVLLAFWAGLSSFGGFIGGALGAWFYFHRRMKVSMLLYADAIIFGLVPGWILGRMGCAVVHDHPGLPSTFFLAVKFPDGAKHDLGLYEMLFTIALTAVLYALKRVRPFYGFHPALMLLLYAPVRFLLDYLRTADKKYFGLTPGQYLAVAIFLGGIALIVYGLRLRKRGIAPHLQPLFGMAGDFKHEERPRPAKGKKRK